MTDITVANTEWAIVGDVIAALEGAQIGGSAVFGDVTVATTREQADECQFTGSTPKVIVRYVTTVENRSPEDVRPCCAAFELIISTRIAGAIEESARAEEILRLANAARNAVAAAPPSAARSWAHEGYSHPAIQWGHAQVDTGARSPWIVCRLPVEVGFVLEDQAAH